MSGPVNLFEIARPNCQFLEQCFFASMGIFSCRMGSFILSVTVINYISHPSSICFENVQAGSVAHTASYSVGTGDYFSGLKRSKRKADHSLLSVPWLRMSVAILPFLLYVIMAFIGTTVSFIVKSNYSSSRSQWPRGLRRRSTAARLLRL